MITLEIRHNREIIKRRDLEPGRYTIGRSSGNDLSFGAVDEEVSGRHAVITISDEETSCSGIGTIEDLSSSYGTYLNRFGIKPNKGLTRNTQMGVPLFYGDCLGFGKKGWGFQIIREDATMTQCQIEAEVTESGDLYLRGRQINAATLSPALKALLIEFETSPRGTVTHEQIYRTCHQRNRPPGAPNVYAQQLVTKLRKILKESERYRGFLFESIHDTGYTMRRPEI